MRYFERQGNSNLGNNGQALPCHKCKTDRHLHWKTHGESVWWIVCENCGASSVTDDGNEVSAHLSQREAGESWNKKQREAEVGSVMNG